ncbi:MAG: ATP-dependent protease subunit HslV [Myxococcota bacterium]|nr:ATP-dependent protease subunit HslV [Myxococcota bacterium]
MDSFHATTILAVKKNNTVSMAADGQVTLGNCVVKHTATKLRKLHDGQVVAGFAGATADAFTLFEKFEEKLKDYSGNISRAAVELAKDWRTDRVLRRLEAMLLVADVNRILLLSGTGDVLEPEHGVAAIGSGGNYALSAARALREHSTLSTKEIATEAMKIAASLCIYTNDQLVFEHLE